MHVEWGITMNIFQDIQKASHNKIESDEAAALAKGFSLSNSENLEGLIRLATLRFVLDDTATTLKLTNLISDIKFDNDFDIWTWVEHGLVLQSAVYRKQGKTELAKECINKIASTFENDPINKRVFMRTLNGDGISTAYSKIQKAYDEEAEYGRRIALLWKLMLIREMGGGEEFSTDRADKEIQENIDRLKILIESFNQ